MGFLEGLLAKFVTQVATRVAEEAILIVKKQTRMVQLDKEANQIKEELASAESAAEREAVLDKVHDLINGIGRV